MFIQLSVDLGYTYAKKILHPVCQIHAFAKIGYGHFLGSTHRNPQVELQATGAPVILVADRFREPVVLFPSILPPRTIRKLPVSGPVGFTAAPGL
jgi:hypothetical protein